MAGAAEKLIEPDDFLAWCATQEERYELVDGEIRMLHDPVDGEFGMMAGASDRHDQIVVNLIAALHDRLKGSPCRPRTADMAVRTKRHTSRRPDVTVDCGDTKDTAMEPSGATAVFEVLSPSTRQTDLVRKLDEYRALASLRHVVLVEPGSAAVIAYSRADDDGEWSARDIDEFEEEIELAAISVTLSMADVYADVTFDGA
ncbi:MAG: Uma2 family endonuclease [Alphaproteobacteria bacterium]|nr:Uma2 family endonuclease [Alphaproteobacteria bacterium]